MGPTARELSTTSLAVVLPFGSMQTGTDLKDTFPLAKDFNRCFALRSNLQKGYTPYSELSLTVTASELLVAVADALSFCETPWLLLVHYQQSELSHDHITPLFQHMGMPRRDEASRSPACFIEPQSQIALPWPSFWPRNTAEQLRTFVGGKPTSIVTALHAMSSIFYDPGRHLSAMTHRDFSQHFANDFVETKNANQVREPWQISRI